MPTLSQTPLQGSGALPVPLKGCCVEQTFSSKVLTSDVEARSPAWRHSGSSVDRRSPVGGKGRVSVAHGAVAAEDRLLTQSLRTPVHKNVIPIINILIMEKTTECSMNIKKIHY